MLVNRACRAQLYQTLGCLGGSPRRLNGGLWSFPGNPGVRLRGLGATEDGVGFDSKLSVKHG